MSPRRALVTGATGGLGRHLVRALVLAGYSVRATGRNTAIGATLAGPSVEFVAGDLSEPSLVYPLVHGADVIFHCAALSSPWGHREAFVRSNITATQNLVDAAVAERLPRLVHVSTPSIYFRYQDQLNIREDAELPRVFANHYAATKAEAEKVVRQARASGVQVTIVRPRALFGEYDSVLIPRLLQIARGGKMPVFNQGQALVDVTYAGNVADALILCDHAAAPPGIFNITNGEPVTVRDLLIRVFRALQRDVRLVSIPYWIVNLAAGVLEKSARALHTSGEPKLLRYPIGLMRYSQTLDINSARDRLGYAPRVTIDEGLARYALWYSQNCELQPFGDRAKS